MYGISRTLARGFVPSRRLVFAERAFPSRRYSDERQEQLRKQLSPHIGFYQSFGRPLFKVFLISIAVYQLTYLAWVKLETDEIERDKTAEVTKLENQLKELTKDKS